MIVRSAIGFFAQNGFSGQTRELAAGLGISQALIFRYFPTKEDLIDRVYEEIFGKEWELDLAMLADRSQPLEARLKAFYRGYAGLILGHEYTRLLLHARQLAFARLSDGARVNVAADGGEAWQALMQAFDWAE